MKLSFSMHVPGQCLDWIQGRSILIGPSLESGTINPITNPIHHINHQVVRAAGIGLIELNLGEAITFPRPLEIPIQNRRKSEKVSLNFLIGLEMESSEELEYFYPVQHHFYKLESISLLEELRAGSFYFKLL